MLGRRIRQTTNRTRLDRRHRPRLDCLEDRTVPTAVTFYLDDTASYLTLSGYLEAFGSRYDAVEQGPGSLTTTYTGVIAADVDTAGGTFNWGTDSWASANDSGNWEPLPGGSAGRAPANYGAQIDFLGLAKAAVRGAVVTAYTTTALPLTDYGNGTFGFPSTQTIGTLAGDADYNHPLIGGGTQSIAGQGGTNQAGDGYLQDFGDGTYFLAAPIRFQVTIDIGGGLARATLVVDGIAYAYGYAGDSPAPGGNSGGQALGYLATLGEMTPAIVTPTFTLPDLAVQPIGQLQQPNSPAQGVHSSLPPEQVQPGPLTLQAPAVDLVFGDTLRLGGF